MIREKFYECMPNFESIQGYQWLNTYHFLFTDQVKKRSNYSDSEVIFELEIKWHNKLK